MHMSGPMMSYFKSFHTYKGSLYTVLGRRSWPVGGVVSIPYLADMANAKGFMRDDARIRNTARRRFPN